MLFSQAGTSPTEDTMAQLRINDEVDVKLSDADVFTAWVLEPGESFTYVRTWDNKSMWVATSTCELVARA